MHAARARIQASLTSLADSLNSEALMGADIAPAYEWAQSVDQVFLQVKWAHKLDAPATLGCKPEPPAFGADSVAFRADCQRKAFALQLQLWGNVSVEQCTWASASVGRASVTLRKAADGPWPRLLKGSVRPQGQHIWWDMKVSLWRRKSRGRGARPNTARSLTHTARAPPPAGGPRGHA